MKTQSNIIIVVLVLLVAGSLLFSQMKKDSPVVPVVPVVPIVPEVIDSHANIIKVFSPTPNSSVASPLVVKGQARGNWYFEASFPVRLYDANGKELAVVPAQAQGEWMTTEFVPFEVTLTFAKPSTSTGRLVLQKDNPSGEPQFDDSISIPVVFAQ